MQPTLEKMHKNLVERTILIKLGMHVLFMTHNSFWKVLLQWFWTMCFVLKTKDIFITLIMTHKTTNAEEISHKTMCWILV